MTVEDNSAGKPSCNCDSQDSCILCVDLTIINPNVSASVQKTEYEICANEEKTFHVIDKGFKAIPLGDGNTISIFGTKETSENKGQASGDKGRQTTTNGVALKVENSNDEPLQVDIEILGRCSLEPEKCPEGLFYIKDPEDTWEVAKKYQGEIPYKHSELSVNYAVFDLLRLLLTQKVPSPEDLMPVGISQYLLSVAKMHDNGSQSLTLNDGKFSRKDYTTPATINIYPCLESSITFTISDNESINIELTDDQKEAIQRAKDNDQYGENNQSKPAPTKRRYRKLGDFASLRNYKFGVSGSVTVGGTKLDVDADKSIQNISRAFGTIQKYSDVLEIADKILGSANGGKPVIEMLGIMPGLEITLKNELASTDDYLSVGYDWTIDIKAKPIIGGVIKADLIQMLAAAFGIAPAIGRMRKALERGDNNISLNADFFIEGTIGADLTVEKKHDDEEWTINLPEIPITIKPWLYLNIQGEVKVFIVSATFKLSMTLEAEFKFLLKYDDKDKDFIAQFYHEGAKGNFKIEGKLGSGNRRRNTSKGTSYTKEWIMYKPLPKERALTIFSYKNVKAALRRARDFEEEYKEITGVGLYDFGT